MEGGFVSVSGLGSLCFCFFRGGVSAVGEIAPWARRLRCFRVFDLLQCIKNVVSAKKYVGIWSSLRLLVTIQEHRNVASLYIDGRRTEAVGTQVLSLSVNVYRAFFLTRGIVL